MHRKFQLKMGRKAKFQDGVLVKRGPGKKTKKQGDPVFPKIREGNFINNVQCAPFLMFKF